MFGNFFVIATPIGNLKDITLRALEVLHSVDIIVCENTRVSHRLLNEYRLEKKTIRWQQHSSAKETQRVFDLVRTGHNLAYLTDAGTPGISDPGNRLVELLWKEFGEAIKIIPLPGPAAALAALSVSGFPTDSFIFKGFIPHKKGRQKFINELKASQLTTVFYESVHRIKKLLVEMAALGLEQEILVARELTKKFETLYRGQVEKIILPAAELKGEFVIVVRGKK